MRILVCGGRYYGYTPESNYKNKDFEVFNWSMDRVAFYKPTVIIQGEAKGGDEVGRLVAKALGIEMLSFPADWGKHKKAAGPIRNKQMLVEGKPDMVIAFEGGKGTFNMIDLASRANIPVVRVTRSALDD